MAEPSSVHRLSRSKRVIFAALALAVAAVIPAATLLAADIYLHSKYQRTGGFNIWGYRGPVAGRKKPGEYRVAVLGGSAAFGYGVKWDESMPAMLERRLAERSAGRRPFSV